jgi:hypothetical protein
VSLASGRSASRRIAALVTIVLAAAPVAGCGSVGRSLSHREVTVVFVPDRTTADVTRVRAACDGVAGAKALPAGPDTAVNRRYPLRFDVTGLDLRQRSKLVGCLSADKAVRGYTDSESDAG